MYNTYNRLLRNMKDRLIADERSLYESHRDFSMVFVDFMTDLCN